MSGRRENTSGPTAVSVPTVVVCDFDGTVTSTDVQHVIFHRFCGDRWIPVNDAWRRGEVSTQERAQAQWGMVDASQQQVLDLVATIGLDPGFADFVALARRLNWTVHIASDGFDFYISRMLAANGLADLPFSANHLEYVDGHVVMTFARPNPACCRLGNCKRLVVEEQRPAGGRVVYIGDGLSDACGAAAADQVFAKGLLARYCEQRAIPYRSYGSFRDIVRALQQDVDHAAIAAQEGLP